jgi:hypothetical protein
MLCDALQEAAKAAAAKKAEEERIAAIERARIEAEKKQAAEVYEKLGLHTVQCIVWVYLNCAIQHKKQL